MLFDVNSETIFLHVNTVLQKLSSHVVCWTQ